MIKKIQSSFHWLIHFTALIFIYPGTVCADFEDGYKYIQKLDSKTKIDWAIDVSKGDSDCLNPIPTKAFTEKMGFRCKEITEHNEAGEEINSTYFTDGQGQSYYIKDRIPGGIDYLGSEYGMVFYKHGRSKYPHIFLVIDQQGRFRESFAIYSYSANMDIFGLEKDSESKPAPYDGWLIATAGTLRYTPCSQAIVDALIQDNMKDRNYYGEYDPSLEILRYGELPGDQYMQIDMLEMPERVLGRKPVPYRQALKGIIEEQMDMATSGDKELISNIKKNDKYSQNFLESLRGHQVLYLAFLAIASQDNKMFAELAHQYKDTLGERMLSIYQKTAICH